LNADLSEWDLKEPVNEGMCGTQQWIARRKGNEEMLICVLPEKNVEISVESIKLLQKLDHENINRILDVFYHPTGNFWFHLDSRLGNFCFLFVFSFVFVFYLFRFQPSSVARRGNSHARARNCATVKLSSVGSNIFGSILHCAEIIESGRYFDYSRRPSKTGSSGV
jgi:hypothetical protein